MPKVGMEEERKTSIIRGAIQAIHERGYASTTMADIAKNAGVSTGLPHHYFGSKAAIFNATMAYLLFELHKDSQMRLKHTRFARERILAIIQTSFDAAQFQPQTVSAWIAFYAQARLEPTTQRLLRLYHRRLIHLLKIEFQRVADVKSATYAAEGTAAMIDGLWLQSVLTGNTLKGEPATALVFDYVQKCFASFHSTSCGVKNKESDLGISPTNTDVSTLQSVVHSHYKFFFSSNISTSC